MAKDFDLKLTAWAILAGVFSMIAAAMIVGLIASAIGV